MNQSNIIRDKLIYYSQIAPKNNKEFMQHFEDVFPGKPKNCPSPDYGCGWYNVWANKYSNLHYEKIKTTIQNFLSIYFPGTNL